MTTDQAPTALTYDAIATAGIDLTTVTRDAEGTWYATDADGFEIAFGYDDGPEGFTGQEWHEQVGGPVEMWTATSEAGMASFGTVAELLAYVREFLETPADL